MPTPPPAAPTPADWLALDHQLCFALYAASLAMTKAYKPLLAPLGLTYPQYLVLLVLWEDDGISVSRLGERLTLDSGTLTPLLKRLEAQGLLRRRRDSTDERRVLLDLTSAGQALREQALAVPQAIACASACDLPQISALAAQLHTLRRQLQPDALPPATISSAAAPVAALSSTSTKD